MISSLTAKAAVLVPSPAGHFLPGPFILFGYGNERTGYAIDIIISFLFEFFQHLLKDLTGTLAGNQSFVDRHRTDKGELIVVHPAVAAHPSGVHTGLRIVEGGIEG